MKHFTDGDGSWQMRLDAGRCPKCCGKLTLSKVDGTIFCDVCGLEVVDSSIVFDTISNKDKESEMETHLMPDEQTIADKEPRMEWQEAVTRVEQALEIFIKEKARDPSLPDVVSEDDLPKLRLAWQRILQG